MTVKAMLREHRLNIPVEINRGRRGHKRAGSKEADNQVCRGVIHFKFNLHS
jgi:hypothetical protein